MNQSESGDRLSRLVTFLEMMAEHIRTVSRFAELLMDVDADHEADNLEAHIQQQHENLRSRMKTIDIGSIEKITDLELLEETMVALKKARAERKESTRPH